MRALSLALLLCVAVIAVEGGVRPPKSSVCRSPRAYIGRYCGKGRVCVRRCGKISFLVCRRIYKISKKHCVRKGKWCPKNYRCTTYGKIRACFRYYKCKYYSQKCKGSYNRCLPCGHSYKSLCCRPQFGYSSYKTCSRYCRGKWRRCTRHGCGKYFRGYCCKRPHIKHG